MWSINLFEISQINVCINSMCGYGNALSFKDVEDSDIEYVQTFIRNRALSVCSKMFDESLSENNEGLLNSDQMTFIFGTTYAAIPDQFVFHLGDIKTIKKLVEHVKSAVDGDGVNKGLHKFKVPKKDKENFIPYPWLNLDSNEKNAPNEDAPLKTEMCVDTMEMRSQYTELKRELFHKIESKLTDYNVDEPIVMSIEENMIEVNFGNNGRIYGRILCIVCKETKKNRLISPCLLSTKKRFEALDIGQLL